MGYSEVLMNYTIFMMLTIDATDAYNFNDDDNENRETSAEVVDYVQYEEAAL